MDRVQSHPEWLRDVDSVRPDSRRPSQSALLVARPDRDVPRRVSNLDKVSTSDGFGTMFMLDLSPNAYGYTLKAVGWLTNHQGVAPTATENSTGPAIVAVTSIRGEDGQ